MATVVLVRIASCSPPALALRFRHSFSPFRSMPRLMNDLMWPSCDCLRFLAKKHPCPFFPCSLSFYFQPFDVYTSDLLPHLLSISLLQARAFLWVPPELLFLQCAFFFFASNSHFRTASSATSSSAIPRHWRRAWQTGRAVPVFTNWPTQAQPIVWQ